MHPTDFNEQYRFGSAGWADERQMRNAGLFGSDGLPIGFHGAVCFGCQAMRR